MSDEITTPEALDALPVGSVVLDGMGDAWQHSDAHTYWWAPANPFYDEADAANVLEQGGTEHPATLLHRPDRPSALALSPRMESEREALLNLLRTEVPSYVDSPSAMWGAAHVLLIARRETSPAPVTVTRRARRNATDAVNDAMGAAGRSLTEHDLTLILDTFLAALGITVTEEGDDR